MGFTYKKVKKIAYKNISYWHPWLLMPWLIVREFENIKGEAWNDTDLIKRNVENPLKKALCTLVIIHLES